MWCFWQSAHIKILLQTRGLSQQLCYEATHTHTHTDKVLGELGESGISWPCVRVCASWTVWDGRAGLSHTHFLSLESATNVKTRTHTHRARPISVERVGSGGHAELGHVPEEENVCQQLNQNTNKLIWGLQLKTQQIEIITNIHIHGTWKPATCNEHAIK